MRTNKIDLGTQAIQSIIKYIDQHHLKDGDKLPTESQWMEQLHCGRSTIREAMRVLAHSGSVVIRQGSGTFVHQPLPHPAQTNQIRSTVKMIENEAIREMMKIDIADDEWITLRAHLSRRNQLLEAGKFEQYIDADFGFHQHLIKMSHNNYLINWYQELQMPWKKIVSKVVVNHKKYCGNTVLHDQMFKALLGRQTKLAIQLNNRFGKY